MAAGDPTGELPRLLQEIARLERELKTASLRDPEILADYAERIRQLQIRAATLKRPSNRPTT